MRKFFKSILFVLGMLPVLICAQVNPYNLSDDQVHRIRTTGSQGNFMGPTLRAQVTKDFCFGGVGGLVEAGFRQVRVNGTLGFALGPQKRDGIKGSIDYLTQDLKFDFLTSSERKWVHQLAGGLAYQHVFNVSILKDLEVGGYYSHSWDRTLENKCVTEPSELGTVSFRDCRRIAGADAWGLNGGIGLQIFSKTILGLQGNYDHVDYNTKYSPDLTKAGFGGTISLFQSLFYNIDLNLQAAFRKPFNFYSGSLNWSPPQVKGLTVGVFGDHTAGKHRLPSSYDFGISLSYAFGPKQKTVTQDGKKVRIPDCSSLVGAWLVQPAVTMPQVLVISDEKLSSNCQTLVAQAPDIVTLNIPEGCCVTTFNVTDEVTANPNITAGITIVYADGSQDGPTREPLGPNNSRTFTIPADRDPCSVRSITAENTTQVFRITAVCCSSGCK
ncbi:hypothetical protein [Simkania sp.]|uniref:hypothetical protein n=1 Tax=Simkania sp. TaxID=34094 RepID=UPI003B51E47A